MGQRIGGAAALVGGLCWLAKGLSILLTGDQPELLFEIAPAFFATAALVLAGGLQGPRRRPAAMVASTLALAAGLVAAGSAVLSDLVDPALGLSMLGLLAALLLVGWPRRHPPVGATPTSRRAAFLIGVGTVPAVVVGGMLEALNERLLEVPLVALALLWAWLGSLMLRGR